MKIRLATVWLGGCAGCHMSFLDLDEFLIDLADAVELVYSPVVDVKQYPENVDLCLIEGAVCNEDNLEILHQDPRAHQGARGLWRLRRHRQRAGHAQSSWAWATRKMSSSAPTSRTRRIIPVVPQADGIVPHLLPRVVPVQEVVHDRIFFARLPAAGRADQGVGRRNSWPGRSRSWRERNLKFG